MTTQTYNEIIITVPVNQLEKAGNIANMTVPYGIYIEDYSALEEQVLEIARIDLIDEELLAKDRQKGLIHIYLDERENMRQALAFLTERFDCEGISYTIDCSSVKAEDWENNWKQYFHAFTVGEGLLIQPLWENCDNVNGREILKIDPGMAFGTGTHATTKLCLERIEQVLKPGDSLLDIGTGSGILSIAALLLGAESAVGVDIDATAVKTARENGKINGFEPPRYTILQGDLARQITGRYDLVAANIVADAIINLCADVKNYMKPGASFIMSGIIDARLDEVVSAVQNAGLNVTQVIEDDGWACIQCKNK